MKTLWLLALTGLLLTGCATPQPTPPPVTLANIIAMAHAGLPDDEIIRQVEDSRTVFRLGADDICRLRQDGVSAAVLNYLLDSYLRYRLQQQRRQDLSDYEWRLRYGAIYGHPWHCW
jgi:hypothetical protein